MSSLLQLLRDTASVPGEGAGVVLSFVVLCPRSFHLQTFTTLFQLLRDTANVPGERAGVVLSFVMLCPCSFQPQTLTLLPAGEGHRQYAR